MIIYGKANFTGHLKEVFLTTIQKKEERGSLLLVFSSAACVRKHLNGVRDRECCICLEREALGILEDEEFTAIWENGTYRIRNEVLDDKKPHYYQTGNRERLLMLLSKAVSYTHLTLPTKA